MENRHPSARIFTPISAKTGRNIRAYILGGWVIMINNPGSNMINVTQRYEIGCAEAPHPQGRAHPEASLPT